MSLIGVLIRVPRAELTAPSNPTGLLLLRHPSHVLYPGYRAR